MNCQVHNHTTLLINNNGRGPETVTEIDNYDSLGTNYAVTWFLPEHTNHPFVEGNLFNIDEFQVYGRAQLAVLGDNTHLFFRDMIGDRTGAVHIGDTQEMDLERPEIDLPFHLRVYEGGDAGLAYETTVHGVDIYVHGTIEHPRNITIHSGGEVIFFLLF